MAATRNKNTQINYDSFIKEQKKWADYDTYKHSASGESVVVMQPGDGFNPGRFSRNALSHNPVRIESFLFGINSTNLVHPERPVTPRFKTMQTNNLYEKDARVIMPAPMTVSKSSRPMQYTSSSSIFSF